MFFKNHSLKKSYIVASLVTLMCFYSAGDSSFAKSNESLQNEINEINLQLDFLKIKVSDNKKKTREIEKKIKIKQQEIQGLSSQINQLAENQSEIIIQIKKLEQDNAESKKQLKELLTRFRSRLVQLHKIRQGTLVSSVLFAKDLNSFLNRYHMVKYLLESDKSIIEELKAKDEKVRRISSKLKEKNKALESGRKEITQKQKDLAKEQASLNAMLNTVLMEKKVLLKKESTLAASRKQLEKQIAEATKQVGTDSFEKELVTAKAAPVKVVSAVPAVVVTEKKEEHFSDSAPDTAKLMNFMWPIDKAYRDEVYEKGDENSNAILIKPVADAEVMAIDKGKVLYKGFLSGLGDVVILGHQRGFSSVYARLDNVWVGLNEVVEKGTVIGKIEGGGNNGLLHFEIRFGGKKMPPLQYLPE